MFYNSHGFNAGLVMNQILPTDKHTDHLTDRQKLQNLMSAGPYKGIINILEEGVQVKEYLNSS